MLATGFPQADAENDFLRARRHQVLAALAHRLSHRPAGSNRLIPLDEVIGDLGRRGERRLGLQTIALDTIVGSVGSRRDFDSRFRPATDRVRPRWERLALAERRGQPVPPIEVYRVGGLHFVSDGHHRVSVAVAAGRPVIDAYVTEILAATPPQEQGIPGTPARQQLRHCGPEGSGWPCHHSEHLRAGSRRAPCGHHHQGRCRKPPSRDPQSPSADPPAVVDHIAGCRPGSR
jgi:hypothetical protein